MKRTVTFILSLLYTTVIYAQNHWMSLIEDDMPVYRLSIPGSHNAATGNGAYTLFNAGITQKKSIEEQWDLGIRAFDLRPSLNNEKLHIYHGPIRTKLTFHDAIEILLNKLSKSPREFAIVILRAENTESKEMPTWAREIGRFIESLGDKAATFKAGIKVEELRGKILFLTRNNYTNTDKGALIHGWSHQPDGTPNAGIVSYADDSKVTLSVQDYYEPTSKKKQEKKLQSIKAYIKAASHSQDELWSINYLSGYASTYLGIKGAASYRGYLQNAEYNHNNIVRFLSDNPQITNCGIIMMDFAGVEENGSYTLKSQQLINSIINLNFIHKKPCKR